jgi:hypothetical protein
VEKNLQIPHTGVISFTPGLSLSFCTGHRASYLGEENNVTQQETKPGTCTYIKGSKAKVK